MQGRRVEGGKIRKQRDVATIDIVTAITRSIRLDGDFAFRVDDNERITVRSVIPHGYWQGQLQEVPPAPIVAMIHDHLSSMAVDICQYQNIFEMVLLSNGGYYFAPDRRYNVNKIGLATPNHRTRSLSPDAAGMAATLHTISSLWSTGSAASEALYHFCQVILNPCSSDKQKTVACSYQRLFGYAVNHRESVSVFALLE